ncbi:flagellar hook-associated protein 1 FlgK [Sagittula marina]|uniref:Flagellar hook-associated protein 1 n=1 Tax=Sagittula marina TaxID=943940 RepID=A0A7W6DVV8_9RHOB|nr:flagellar hook-associated protein FlgK [Sagittula marina]MBB3987088.1 flagellar hook-associated protein 1 FlgK [Sagittula marina]
MSLISALNAARSGMSTSSRWADTVSTNIANANNASYARRETQITTNAQGAAQVSEITRAVDSALDGLYRTEVSRTATQDAIATGLAGYTALLGDTESTDTMLTRLTDFQNALGLLSVSPADTGLQRATVADAQELAQALNRAGGALDAAMGRAEEGVVADVAAVNDRLGRIAALSERLASSDGNGEAPLSVHDALGAELDALAEYMDVTTRTDGHGRMEVFTSGGTALLTGGRPETLRFDAESGTLWAGSVDITPGVSGKRGISEGSISGKVALYTTVLPEMQAQLDETARALISGMEAADASLLPGEAGLFTDAGAALTDPVAPGLARRIAVNEAVVPEVGGALWRIRDGVGAVVPGAAGANGQVMDFADALNGSLTFDEAHGLGSDVPLSRFMSSLIASQNSTRASAETSAERLAAGAIATQTSRMSFMGVNVDDELQQLAMIQQSYGANAQALSTVSEMIDTLLAAV